MAKTYPFSMKRAHDIEFYSNRLYNTMCDMESGEIPWDEKRFNRIYDMYHGELAELRDALWSNRNPYVAQLTGKQIGLAKRIVIWASETRANTCIEKGRYDLVKYC